MATTITHTDPALPCNVRDLGGLPTVDGRRVRPGVLLRGDDPGRGTPDAQERLQRTHGIRHVIDLRNDFELHGVETFVTRPEVTRHRIPMSMLEAMVDPTDVPRHAEGFGALYARHVDAVADDYLRAVRVVAGADSPVLVHCAHGKDRTGMVVAVILLVVGATDEAIVADYQRTTDALPVLLPALDRLGMLDELPRTVSGSTPEALLKADAPTMQAALRHLREDNDGDPIAPLRRAGLADDEVARLRDRAMV